MILMHTKTVTVTTLARALGVHSNTVLRHIQAKRLRAIDVSAGRVRPTYKILRSSAQDFLRARGFNDGQIEELLAG